MNDVKTTQAGQHQFHVCKALDIAGLTVWSTLKNKHKIKECGKAATPLWF
jgi:hypothetical protein